MRIKVYLNGVEQADWYDLRLVADPPPSFPASGGVHVAEGILRRFVRDCVGNPIVSNSVVLCKEYRGVITLEATK